MPIQKETACKAIAIDNIEYITSPQKTTDEEGRRWVHVHNMAVLPDDSPVRMQKDFDRINRMYKKNRKYHERKYYHAIINFKTIPGMTAEKSMRIGEAYVKHFFPTNQAVMAVHMDKDGFDFHACINSVDLSGKKVQRSDVDLMIRKDYVNEIAKEMYGIEPFDWRAAVKEKRKGEKKERPLGVANNYSAAEKRMHAEGRKSELDDLRAKILAAASVSKTRKEFEAYLHNEGVTMPRNTKNTVSFKYKEGKTGTVRGSTLGDHYRAEYIDKLLEHNRKHPHKALPKEQQAAYHFNDNDMKRIVYRKDAELAENWYGFRYFEYEERYKRTQYRRSEPFGIWMSRAEFYRSSPGTLVMLYAVACILLSKPQETVLHVREGQEVTKGIVFRNGTFEIEGIRAKTDLRIQRMADALSAATAARLKYKCQDRKDLEQLHSELLAKQEETATELRKERRIETAYKNKLARKKTLLQAAKQVFHDDGTPEELKKAKHLLYRNGISKEEFSKSVTAARIELDVKDAEEDLDEQSRKVKELFFDNRDRMKEISDLSKALETFEHAYDPGYYYGWTAPKKASMELGREEVIDNEEAFDDMLRVDDVLEQAYKRSTLRREYEKTSYEKE